MTLSLLVDTDVLIKCACYALLEYIQPPSAATSTTGILGAARFVVRHHLENQGRINDRLAAKSRFEEYLRGIAILEPTDEELRLASAIEDAGLRLGLALDIGESQLCAIAVFRATAYLLTGDKRAIASAELLQSEMPDLSVLRRRIICLEQALIDIAGRIGVLSARLKICAEPGVDKSLSICFECHSDGDRSDYGIDGLISYVSSLREKAGTLLYEAE